MDRLPEEGRAQRMAEWECLAEIAVTTQHKNKHSFPARTDDAESAVARQALLARTIETEIIPRLMLAHGSTAARRGPNGSAPQIPGIPGVAEFTLIVLRDDFTLAMAYIESLRAERIPLETLCADLLAPTARRLGEMWVEDRCDFAEVTLGLWRLEQILRELCETAPDEAIRRRRGLHALLVPSPGEQHTFGLAMVMEFFRRAGWDVHGGAAASMGELQQRARDDWFDIVGLSMSSEAQLDSVAACIRTLRRASRNADIGVMVGGRVFLEHPELAAQVGADVATVDGRDAPAQAERLLAVLAQARR